METKNATNESLVFSLWSVSAHSLLITKYGQYSPTLLKHDEVYPSLPRDNNSSGLTEEDDAENLTKFEFRTSDTLEEKPTTMCLFGKTATGQNVLARVVYRPFIYVEIPKTWRQFEIHTFITDLSKWLRNVDVSDIQYSVEQRKYAYGWIPADKTGATTATFQMLKVRLPNEKLMRIAGAVIRKRTNYYNAGRGPYTLKVHERDGRFSVVHKFCDDLDLLPTGWLEIPPGAWKKCTDFAGHADIEVEVEDFSLIKARNEITDVPPLVIASFDLECVSEAGVFPDPSQPKDYIIGIGTTLKRLGQQHYEHYYFALGEARVPITSKLKVFWFQTELEMFEAWHDWLMEINPDVITGYNINSFDFHYFDARMQRAIGRSNSRLSFMSRLWGQRTPLVSANFSSNAAGERKFYTYQLDGRLVIDMMEIIRREKKLRSYKLDAVARKFLVCPDCKADKTKIMECKTCTGSGQMSKLDLSAQGIFKNFVGTAEDRGVIGEYCSMDCELVLELMFKLCSLQNIMEMGKVTMTPCQDVVSKGQQVKAFSQIIWYGHRDGFVINDSEDVILSTDGYEGARVLDAHPGFHDEPVTTLDFSSLYPSIMRTHNLCPSTWVKKEEYATGSDGKFEHVNTGPRKYIFAQHIPGIVPKILTTLLTARKKVKKQMGDETDPFKKSVLDAKQNALKTSANSIYGFFGTGKTGKYPCLAVSDSTTYFGRVMITQLKATIEDKYPGAVVIYGDTDSVMVKFPMHNNPDPIPECFRLGNQVATLAHEMFGGVIELTMEKVFWPYLLLSKKRYAGMSYEDPKKPPKMKMSGVEAVRRDFAILVSDTYEKVLYALLRDRSVSKAVSIVKDKLKQLEDDTIPFAEYVLSCQVKGHYKNPNQHQQVVVDKMKKRAPGSEPKSGDRMQYVIVQIDQLNAPTYKKVEDAGFALENKVPLDRLHYLENQFERPFTDLLVAFVKDPKSIFDATRYKLMNSRDKMQNLRDLLKRKSPLPTTETVAPSFVTPVAIKESELTQSKPKRSNTKGFDPRQPTLSKFKPKTSQ